MEAVRARIHEAREVGVGVFVVELQRYLLAVGAAVELGDTAGALDLLAVFLGALSE